jgi:hypothetical protein
MPARILGCAFIDLLRSHRAGDLAHLLADVVGAVPGRKGLKLRLQLGFRLAFEAGTAGFVAQAAVAFESS